MRQFKRKNILLAIILIAVFGLSGCGENPVIPDPYIPGDYEIPTAVYDKAPYDFEGKSVDNELSIIARVNLEDYLMFAEFAQIVLFGGPILRAAPQAAQTFSPKNMRLSGKNLGVAEDTILASLVLAEDSITFLSNGQMDAKTGVSFFHEIDSSNFTLNGQEYSLNDIYLPEMTESPDVYNLALTEEEVSSLTFAKEIKGSLAARYSFEDKLEPALDSANGNNGKFQGDTEISQGDYNTTCVFDGSRDYIVVPNSDSLSFSSEMTVSFWVNPAFIELGNGVYTFQQIVSKNGYSTNNFHAKYSNFDAYIYRDELGFAWTNKNGKTAYVRTKDINLKADKWYFISIRVMNDRVEFYVDGEKKYEQAIVIDLSPNKYDMLIGAKQVYSTYLYGFLGQLDEISLINRALSAEEIYGLYRSYFIK